MREKKPVLIYGYGNPGRLDDGLGPAFIEKVSKLGFDFVDFDANYQLNIEDAASIEGRQLVIFVDSSVEGERPFIVKKLLPSRIITFTTHHVDPESILALCKDLFGASPNVWLLAIRGYNFGYGEGLSNGGSSNLNRAVDFIKLVLSLYKGKNMAEKQKTILIIDDDPDIRASMRIVLEAAGFSVGEAGDGEEGLKVAEKIKPDAIIVDLMMETVDAGSRVSTSLKESGYDGPIFLLSSAGDAVRYNIDPKELGLAGIFQKPIDHEVLINTLKAKLKD